MTVRGPEGTFWGVSGFCVPVVAVVAGEYTLTPTHSSACTLQMGILLYVNCTSKDWLKTWTPLLHIH